MFAFTSPSSVDRVAPRRLVVLVATVLALLWQGFATGTHVHLPRPIAAMEQEAARAPAVHHGRHGRSAADCALCWAVAQAGHYVTPDGDPAPDAAPLARPALHAPLDATPHGLTWSPARPIRGPPLRPAA